MFSSSWFWFAGSRRSVRPLAVWLSSLTLLAGSVFPLSGRTIAQTLPPEPDADLCPAAALDRVQRHRIAPGDTLVSLAQQYELIPATLMGMNPALRDGSLPVGAEILIPPYNGIRVPVPAGTTWTELAAAYGVRADVLFEVNGCQPASQEAFIPGVNWAPGGARSVESNRVSLDTYPLPGTVEALTGFGWQVDTTSQIVFHSGVDLQSEVGTPVRAVAAGTVAFAGEQGNYGNLVVLNHAGGLQTRYAQLDSITVQQGQAIGAGDRLGTVGQTGDAHVSHLHFEVRRNSDLGWVAENPTRFFPSMEVGR
ncbi:MAG: M23 family metallopeptidase [Cyanobacteria bacterium J06638_20]